MVSHFDVSHSDTCAVFWHLQPVFHRFKPGFPLVCDGFWHAICWHWTCRMLTCDNVPCQILTFQMWLPPVWTLFSPRFPWGVAALWHQHSCHILTALSIPDILTRFQPGFKPISMSLPDIWHARCQHLTALACKCQLLTCQCWHLTCTCQIPTFQTGSNTVFPPVSNRVKCQCHILIFQSGFLPVSNRFV